jgi:hypothetical protein
MGLLFNVVLAVFAATGSFLFGELYAPLRAGGRTLTVLLLDRVR